MLLSTLVPIIWLLIFVLLGFRSAGGLFLHERALQRHIAELEDQRARIKLALGVAEANLKAAREEIEVRGKEDTFVLATELGKRISSCTFEELNAGLKQIAGAWCQANGRTMVDRNILTPVADPKLEGWKPPETTEYQLARRDYIRTGDLMRLFDMKDHHEEAEMDSQGEWIG